MKHSTQLGAVRKRGRQVERGLPGPAALALLEWSAERAVYDDKTGKRIAGDDPADPRTHAKVNPAYGVRISADYVHNEAEALGGYESVAFGTERLGIGEWPDDEERWEVIDKTGWLSAMDQESKMLLAGRCFAVDADPETGIYTLSVSGLREDGAGHIETCWQQKGAAWIPDKLVDLVGSGKALKKPPLILLKNGEASHVGDELANAPGRARFTVHMPTETEYVQGCEALVEELRQRRVFHIGQKSLTGAIGAAAKLLNVEGGWKWDRDQLGQAPIVAATLARWGVRKGLGKLPKSAVY
jgi:hypothetical protein